MALFNTCLGFFALLKFLFQSRFTFVMMGSFTTDPLERQFGKFRQNAGEDYLITVRAVMERRRIDKARCLQTLIPIRLL
jgi:hypothetical protein